MDFYHSVAIFVVRRIFLFDKLEYLRYFIYNIGISENVVYGDKLVKYVARYILLAAIYQPPRVQFLPVIGLMYLTARDKYKVSRMERIISTK